MEPKDLEQRLAELERAEAEHRDRQDRQIADLNQRVASLESFLTKLYG